MERVPSPNNSSRIVAGTSTLLIVVRKYRRTPRQRMAFFFFLNKGVHCLIHFQDLFPIRPSEKKTGSYPYLITSRMEVSTRSK